MAAWTLGRAEDLRACVRDDAVWLSAPERLEGPDAVAAHLSRTTPDRDCSVDQHGSHAVIRSATAGAVIEVRAGQIVFGADVSH